MSRLYADIHRKIGAFSLDVTIESDAGRIGILGASGSGKSMTLRSIAGIEDVDSGRVEVNGRVLFDSDSRIDLRPQKRNVGYMFQNYALFPTMTVLKNVMAGMKGKAEDRRDKAMDMLERFRMSEYADRLPGELSGGQQQRAALARIMVTEPELILLDEPFSALDGYLRDRMQVEMLEMLDGYQGQVIMVSHSRDELYRFSEELFVVRQGEILRHGETKSVFSHPERIEVARLTGCKNFSKARIIDRHTIEAEDWGIELSLRDPVPEWLGHIGYRAHYFEPVWGEREENCISFDLVRVDELPFEKNYYIRPETGGAGSRSTAPDHRTADPDRNTAAPDHRTAAPDHKAADPDHNTAAPDHRTADPDRRTADPDHSDLICWFVQGEEQKLIDQRGLPDHLRLTEENILFLK